jgi:DNA adenine methylase
MIATGPLPLKPLLKWAGGKRQLLPTLRHCYPDTFDRYIEPFFGSGAVFFDLLGHGRLANRRVRLFDVNPDLIGCYRTLRDHRDEVIAALGRLEREHRRGGDAHYYRVRDERFNRMRTNGPHGAAAPEAADAYTPELAAMLIFLNRTGFNGLFRLNRQGEFNVPVGRYVNPTICDVDHLHRVADAFNAPGVALECRPFADALADAGAGDFVYCDPPYAPLSATANFAHYSAGGFSALDQQRLQRAVIAACRRGAQVVVSNSSAPEIVAGYQTKEALEANLKLSFVDARRAINSRASARGAIKEVVVTNVSSKLEAIRPPMLKMTQPRAKAKTA